MPGNWSSSYRLVAQHAAFDPDNSGYKAQVRGFYNRNLRHIFTLHPWTFARKVVTLPVYADVTAGTCQFAVGSRAVMGVGTAWTTAMEGMYIQEGTSGFNPGYWARIGRVASTTALVLEKPWTRIAGTISVGSYTARQRTVAMPRDCVRYQNIIDSNADRGLLTYRNPYEVDRIYLDEDIAGTPFWYTDAATYSPPTPERALTATASVGAGLTSGTTYTYFYTWVIGGSETGKSPDVTVTPSGANLRVTLTGMQETGATDGRYLRLYRADDVGIAYKVADYSFTSSIIDDGSTLDRDTPYVDVAQTQNIRVFPRNGGSDTIYVDVRYHYMCREIQKDSDYPDLPADAVEAVEALTIADILDTNNNPGGARVWRDISAARVRAMCGIYLAQEPDNTVRRTWIGSNQGYRAYIPNPTIT